MHYWFLFAQILLRIFSSVITKDAGLKLSICVVAVCFLYKGDVFFIETTWKYFGFSTFLEELEKNWK